jgi:hypothetical protein
MHDKTIVVAGPSLLKTPPADWNTVLAERLTSHFSRSDAIPAGLCDSRNRSMLLESS